MVADLLELRLTELLELAASDDECLGGGATAAVVIAMAASLVTRVGRSSSEAWQDGAGVAAQAVELQRRCPELARDDAAAWERARSALAGTNGGPGGDARLAAALGRAAEVPLAIAEIGADVARLASLAAQRGDAEVRGEAVAAAVLAHAGVRAAAHLVSLNLAVHPADERCDRAERAERDAASAVAAALDAGD